MDSFLSLFDPNDNEGSTLSFPLDDFSACDQLPPEPQLGNIEYKLKLVNPTKLRFQHLVTQMKWRLREGQGEAIYEIGVEDGGTLAGLPPDDLAASLRTLQQMAEKLGATCTTLRERNLDNGRKVAELLVRKVPDDQHNIEVRVAVMGSADAGKSTLLGVLSQGELDNGRGRARLNMFRHLHEVQTGRTSSISHEILGFDAKGSVVNYNELLSSEEICERSSKLVTFIDLAGHKKYLKTTVAGISGYVPHYAMIVVSGSAGVLGMTHEHLAISCALQVPFFIVITKIDVTPASSTIASIENLLSTNGCKKVSLLVKNEDSVITAGSNQHWENVVPVFCVSCVTGEGLNLLTKFLHLLPPGVSIKEKERLEQELCEFQIDETFQIPDVGAVVGGLLTKGSIMESTKLLLGPFNDGRFVPVLVQTIHRNKRPCRLVRATQSASLTFTPEVPGIRKGMVLLNPELNPSASTFFQASVVLLFHSTVIRCGFQTTVHIGSIRQTAVIEGILSTNGIHTDERASVLFRFVRHPEFVSVGMRLLFREGRTKGIGTITQIFPEPSRAG